MRLAVRRLRRSPGFTAAVVSILALGIGLNVSVFSLVNAALFRPLPVAAPDELVAIYRSTPTDFMNTSPLTGADYHQLSDECRTLASVLAYTYTPVAVEHGGESRIALAVRATPNFFSTLGVRPSLGRFFDAAEHSTAGSPVVLSHATWARRFGADPLVVGSTLLVGGRPATIIGVAPREFFGLTRGVAPEFWTPLELERSRPASSTDLEPGWLWVMGRRAPGVGVQQVEAELATLARRGHRAAVQGVPAFVSVPANEVRILPQLDARIADGSAIVLGVVALVLLVACTNVANLLLARSAAGRRDVATRLALGASKATIARQVLIESGLLALLGAALGLALAQASHAAMATLHLPLPVDIDLGVALDARVVLFAVAASAATAVASGLAPALAAARAEPQALLQGGGTVAGSPMQRRVGDLLVILQVAVSLVLLVEMGLLVRSLRNTQLADPGFEPRGVVVATFMPGGSPGHSADDALQRRLLERIRGVAGVRAAAVASHLPLSVEVTFERVAAVGKSDRSAEWTTVDSALVGPGYVETMRIPLLRGRAIDPHDQADRPPVAMVNETFAARFWPGQEALGRGLRIDSEPTVFEVVGVVRDGKYRTLGESPRPFLYRAVAQAPGLRRARTGEVTTGSMTVLARMQEGAPSAISEMRTAIREVDPGAAIARVETLEERLQLALFLPRMAAALFGVLGLAGMALAMLGLHSLLAYTVSQRYREIGIRLAVGASPRDVAARVVLRAGRLVLVGILVGLPAAALASRQLSPYLHGVDAADPVTFTVMAACLAFASLTASWLPARRASSVDVTSTLRHE